jgi:indole-3-acetate monooxygenase
MSKQQEANRRALELTRVLVPFVRENAESVEAAGSLTPIVLDALRDAELFWIMVPEDLGGGGADIVTGMQCIEEMTRADGSIGWSFMANTVSVTNAVAFLPPSATKVLFADGLPIIAGMLAPRGTAVPTGDGFTVSGNYQFGSGIGHAEWVTGGAFVRENGKVRSTPSGGPELRAFLVPRSGVELRDNWDVMGLNGTGSFDFHINEQYVDESFGYAIPDTVPTRSEPSFQLGFMPLGSLGHGAIGIGIALRAIEEISVLARSKRRPGNPGMAEQQLFLHDFALKEGALQAARCFLFDSIRAALRSAERTGSTSADEQARMIQATTYATKVAADVVQWCYGWSGSDGLRHPSALGRCVRDMAGATQHVLVDPNSFVGIAPALLAGWSTRETSPFDIGHDDDESDRSSVAIHTMTNPESAGTVEP